MRSFGGGIMSQFEDVRQGTFWGSKRISTGLYRALSSQRERKEEPLLRQILVPFCRHRMISFTAKLGWRSLCPNVEKHGPFSAKLVSHHSAKPLGNCSGRILPSLLQ